MHQSKPKIVVVGSSNTDMIVQAPSIPKPGETILGGTFSIAAGGKGANQAVAAARAGGDVSFIACLGNDDLGRQALAGYKTEGIDVKHVSIDDKDPSGVALIVVDADGENSIAVASGANLALSSSDIDVAADLIKTSQVLLMQLESPVQSVKHAAQIAARHQVKVILNPAPAQELDDELLGQIDIITPNEIELAMLTGQQVGDVAEAELAAQLLLEKGPTAVIVTLGKEGSLLCRETGCKLIPGITVDAVDTTAAGDVFNGVLAVALAEGQTIKEAIGFANIAAGISVTRLGAHPSIPRRGEIEKILAANL